MKIIRLLVLIHGLILALSFQTSAKTIIYDRVDGFAETLPFDELFQIKLKGFPADSFKLLQMVFKELSSKPKSNPGDNPYKNDSTYFNALDNFMTISFDNNGIGVVYRQLEPNKYYFVELSCVQQRLLPKSEREAIVLTLQADESIKKNFLDSLKTAGFSSKNIDALNAIIYQRIKAINTDYKIADMANPVYNDSIEAVFRDIEKNSAEIGQALENVSEFVNNNTAVQPFAGEVKDLFTSVLFTNSQDSVYLPAVTGPVSDYNRKVDVLFNKLSGAAPTQEKDLAKIQADIKSGLDKVSKQTDKWIALVDRLISVTTEHIYTTRVLVFTKPDESLVEGTANKLNASISQTFGWGLSPKTSSGFLYVGYSLFFRAVNPSVPFRNIPAKDRWKAMVGANLGFTLTDMTTNNYGKASGVVSFLGDKALMLGICFRPYHFIKLDFNGLLYTLNDPNPLINHKRLAFAPLIGISLSLNVVKLFSGQPNSFTTLSDNLKK